MIIQNLFEVNVFETRFHKLRVNDLIKYIVEAGKIDKKTIIANVNIRGMNFAYQLSWYRNFINKALNNLPFLACSASGSSKFLNVERCVLRARSVLIKNALKITPIKEILRSLQGKVGY